MTVVVQGSGPVELAAALEFASVGIPVYVVDDATGGWREAPAEDPDGSLGEWIDVASDGRVNLTRTPAPRDWVEAAGRLVPVPEGSVFGVPHSPLAIDVSSVLGTSGAFRAYLDRVTPILTIGQTRLVGDLVRKRVGARLLDTFVEPLVRHRWGCPASDVEVAQLAPGLSETVSRVGSLTGGVLAYMERYEALTTTVEPEGGWHAFERVLRARLTHFGAMFGGEAPGVAQLTVARHEPEGHETRTVIDAEVERPAWWPDKAERVIRVHDAVWTSAVTREGERFRAQVRSSPGVGGLPEFHSFDLVPTSEDRLVAHVHVLEDVPELEGFLSTTVTHHPDGLARAVRRVRERAVAVRREILGLTP